MTSDPHAWEQRSLYELAEYINGRATKPNERVPDGVPVIKIAELTRGITANTDRVPAENVQDRHWVRDGDLLFAWSGTVGVHVYRGQPAALNQHIFRVVARRGVSPRFLEFLLKAQLPLFRRFVADRRTTMGHVTVADLRGTVVHIPPCVEQQRIAWVLGSIDDKIEVNRQMAKTLEEIAATIFKARFVDFVGVEEFEDSELGPIPKGWCVFRFSEVVDINPPVPLRKGTVTPYIEMSSLPPWGTRPTNIRLRPYHGGSRFQPGDTLMARITGCIEHGKGAFVDFVEEPSAGSTEYLVLRAKELLTPEAVFFLSRTDRVREHAIANMSGSSGRQRVPKECFDQLSIALPRNRKVWKREARLMEATMHQTNLLWRENKTLSAIRDTLLPKLISGEIRVPEGFGPEDAGEVAEELAASVSDEAQEAAAPVA